MEQQEYRRWDSNSWPWELLLSLIVNNQIPDRMPTQMVQDLYPQFRCYPSTNFATILSRFRKKVASGEIQHLTGTPSAPPPSAHVTPAEFAGNFYSDPST
jgi:hypothetical protein